MPLYATNRVWWILVCVLAGRVLANPQLAFPINAQIPPVAYVSQPFSFTFSQDTFTSDASQISYTLSNQPTWLLLDSNARSLTGVPTTNDVGAANFEITASDMNGQTLSNVTLVVLQQQRLFPNNDGILSQLSSAGAVSPPATLLQYPQRSFDISLTPNLFEGASTGTIYYAVSSDGSPLPSWIQFDSQTLRISGTTPPLVSPSPAEQAFVVKIAATETVGFSETAIDFEILISDHLLTFGESSYTFTSTTESMTQIPSLLNNIQFDGTPARRDQIAAASANSPDWLYFNSTDLSFAGTAPANGGNATFVLVVDGLGANAVNTTIALRVQGQEDGAQQSLGNVSVASGSYLVHSIDYPTDLNKNTNISTSASNLPEWLSFTSSNLTLHGLAPNVTSLIVQTISFTFSSAAQTQTANLTINVNPTSPSSKPSASASATGSGASANETDNASALNRNAILILAIGLPILAVIFLICIILFCLRKRKQDKNESHKDGRRNDSNTGGPTPPQMRQTDSEPEQVLATPEAVRSYEDMSRAGSDAPQLELPWAPNSIKQTRHRMSKKPRTSYGSIVRSSWDDLMNLRIQSKDSLSLKPSNIGRSGRGVDAAKSTKSHMDQPMSQRPARPVRPTSLFQQRPSEMFRIPQSPISDAQAVGMPKRMSGAGHGAGGQQPLNRQNPRSSWQTTMGTIPQYERNSNSGMMSPFPALPSRESMDAITGMIVTSPRHSKSTRGTLWLVESNSSGSFNAARHQFYGPKANEQYGNTKPVPTTTSRTSSLSAVESAEGIAETSSKSKEMEIGEGDSQVVGYGKTPPLPPKSQARLGTIYPSSSETDFPHPSTHLRKPRDMSAASSHQFDSAASSDSQWEDGDIVPDESVIGKTYSQTSMEPADVIRPLNPHTAKDDMSVGGIRTEPGSHEPRLVEQRKHVSIQDSRFGRTERSHKGSLRFI